MCCYLLDGTSTLPLIRIYNSQSLSMKCLPLIHGCLCFDPRIVLGIQLPAVYGVVISLKFLKNLAPQYLCNLFNKNLVCSSHNFHSTNSDNISRILLKRLHTDIRLPKKNKMSFPSLVLRYGIVSLLKENWHRHHEN